LSLSRRELAVHRHSPLHMWFAFIQQHAGLGFTTPGLERSSSLLFNQF
jgi:hypothetical protein